MEAWGINLTVLFLFYYFCLHVSSTSESNKFNTAALCQSHGYTICFNVCVDACQRNGTWQQAAVPHPLRLLAHYPEVTAHAWPLPAWPPSGEQRMLGYGSHVLITNNPTSCPGSGERHKKKQRGREFWLRSATCCFHFLHSHALSESRSHSLASWLFTQAQLGQLSPAPVLGTKYSLPILFQTSSHTPPFEDMSHVGQTHEWGDLLGRSLHTEHICELLLLASRNVTTKAGRNPARD